jgi:hypothetical protein
VSSRSSRRAIAFKVPARGLLDFHLQTVRSHASVKGQRRSGWELAAGIVEGVRDPIGLALYIRARLWSERRRRSEPPPDVERWVPAASTKERP